MGSVYLGENTAIGRRVAVKVMNAELQEHDVLLDRFEREARAVARIRSAHVVEVLDLAKCDDGLRYMVMEYLDGESLGDRLTREGRLSLRDVSLIAIQMLEGVHAIHAAGIIHRDLKPDNVFLAVHGDGEIVKILDFGVSKVQFDPRDVTLDGTAVGTPSYMSPEQARGRSLDARSDLFTVAVLLYEAATGHLPFVSSNVNDLLFKIALDPPTPIEKWLPDVEPELAAIIRRGMDRDPDKRFQSALEFQAAIAAWRERVLGEDEARGELLELAYGLSGEHWAAWGGKTPSGGVAAASGSESWGTWRSVGARTSRPPRPSHVSVRKGSGAPGPSDHVPTRWDLRARGRAFRWGGLAAMTVGLALFARPSAAPPSHAQATGAEHASARESASKTEVASIDRAIDAPAQLPAAAAPAPAPHPAPAKAHRNARSAQVTQVAAAFAATPNATADSAGMDGYRGSPYDAIPY